MARGGGSPISDSPRSAERVSSRLSQITASSSVWSARASPSSTSAISPIIRLVGKGQGWLEW